jgi:CheY-like chemotaxis protein
MPTKRTILVAEDDPNDAFLLKRCFLRAGITVQIDFVADGQEAIDYLQRDASSFDPPRPQPELLLLDLKMPKLDGFDVLSWIRGQSRLKRLPVTVLTSSSLRADINRAFDLGANSYIVKPSNADAFAEISQRLYDYWLKLNASPDFGN